jgi:hypothetical protein
VLQTFFQYAMKLSLKNRTVRTRRRLARGIVMLFLIYTGLDLASPQLCKGDALGDAGGRETIAATFCDGDENIPAQASINKSSGEQQDQPSEEPCNDEDCFCCCAHILPGTITVSLETSDAITPATFSGSLSTPTPSLASEFHPPRIA